MLYKSFTKKYASLVISSALHALIIALLLFSWMRNETESIIPLRHKPADVSFYLPSTQSPVAPSAAQSSLPPQNPQNPSAQSPTEPRLSSQSIRQEKLDQRVPPPQERQMEPEHSTSKAPSGKQSTYPEGNISPGSFMKAFQAAVKAEREGIYANEGSESSQIPLHVKERLNQWGQISYKQRISEALLQADKKLSRSIISQRSLKTRVHLTITIQKDGSLGHVEYHKYSGIPDIDRYIKDLIEGIDFAPIPDRFNSSTFPFPVTIDVTLQEGTNRIRLYVV